MGVVPFNFYANGVNGESQTRELLEGPEACFLFRVIEGMFKNLKFNQKTKRKLCSREMYIIFVNLTISQLVEGKQLRTVEPPVSDHP